MSESALRRSSRSRSNSSERNSDILGEFERKQRELDIHHRSEVAKKKYFVVISDHDKCVRVVDFTKKHGEKTSFRLLENEVQNGSYGAEYQKEDKVAAWFPKSNGFTAGFYICEIADICETEKEAQSVKCRIVENSKEKKKASRSVKDKERLKELYVNSMPSKPVADAGVNRSTQDSPDTGYSANLLPMLPVSDVAAVDVQRSPPMDSQPLSGGNASGPSKSVLATKNVPALDIQRFPGGIASGVELNKSVNAISEDCESVLCDEDFPPSSGTSRIPNEMSKSLDIQVAASGNSSGAALPAIQNSGRDIPYSVPPEVANGASSSAFAPGRIDHLRAITSVPGVRDVVAKNRYGMDIHSDAPPLVIREENPRIIRHEGGYKKFIWYWQAKAEGTVQLRRGYDIYVYTTILDDCKMKHPIWNPKTYTAHAWELVQHLMGGDEGIIACYENRYDNQGVDFLLGRNTIQAVLGYVTELYKLQQPMKELSAFKAMINTRLLQLFRSRKQSMSGASKKRKLTDD